MKILIIHRKRKFASSLMPYWIVTGTDKKSFMKKYNLKGDLCKTSLSGQPISRITPEILQEYHLIKNEKSVKIELTDNIDSVFAITFSGNLSNEIMLNNGIEMDGVIFFNYCLTTKGGFFESSYPWFIE